MMLLDNSIYESRMGFPVYYHHSNGYVPNTPPYSTWEQQQQHHQGFTKSDRESPFHHPPLVYPQFPTPPLSVSPGTSRYNTPSPQPTNSSSCQRAGDSFQIKKLLNLEEDCSSKMRTASVIMKIEDQRVFQVDSTTTSTMLTDDSSFDRPYRSTSSSSECGAGATTMENLFVCKWEKCYKVFCHLHDLATHVTQAHGSAPMGSVNYYCKWEGCPRTDRGFNARYKMLVHIRTHTKEKPHQCPECCKCFSRAENLKIHIRSHSGEKPYVCPVEGCNKAYSNSSDRFKHTRTHAMTKPYQCKVAGCNKRYTDPSSLRKHVKTYKHKTSHELPLDEESERITSTSDDVDEECGDVTSLMEQRKKPAVDRVFYSSHVHSSSNTTCSIDQQMTELDLHERSPCYCGERAAKTSVVACVENSSSSSWSEEQLKLYRLGAVFNVHSGDALVSSSRPEAFNSPIGGGASASFTVVSFKEPMDLEAPLDLSVRHK